MNDDTPQINTPAFINAIAEEGTKEDAIRNLQETWNERCALQAEVEALTTAGVIEVSVKNPSVREYMHHWERRAEKAEAEVIRLREALAFYAVSDNWRIGGELDGNSGNFTGGPARAALTSKAEAV